MTKPSRVSIVRRLIDLGLASDEFQAHDLIGRRAVLVQGAVVDNPGRLVALGDPVVVRQPDRFVSRGGAKLQAALDHFDIDVKGRTVLDIGASTGGFTDCALQAGAQVVFSLDVGKTQLHERLLSDPRVVVVDDFNARSLDVEALRTSRGMPSTFDVIVVDVSFISVRRLVPSIVSVTSLDSDVIILVKPQFEATKEEADRGAGVISSPEIRERVVAEVCDAFDAGGCSMEGSIPSPISGASGNVEFLAHFRMRP